MTPDSSVERPGAPAAPPDAPAVQLTNVTVAYDGNRPALKGASVTIPRGSWVAVLGPNGAGKTTFFKAILGLVSPSEGEVRVFGMEPRKARRRIAYIPQREAVDWRFPLRAIDVVMMGRENHIGWRLRPRASDRQAVEQALRQVGMWEWRHAGLDELSGGQQQRLFIARALAGDAPLCLLDEPFNEVDAGTRDMLLDLFAGLVRAGRTVVVSLHDLDLARRRFPQALFINKEVVAHGPTAEVFTPAVLQRTYMEQVLKWEENGETRSVLDGHSLAPKV